MVKSLTCVALAGLTAFSFGAAVAFESPPAAVLIDGRELESIRGGNPSCTMDQNCTNTYGISIACNTDVGPSGACPPVPSNGLCTLYDNTLCAALTTSPNNICSGVIPGICTSCVSTSTNTGCGQVNYGIAVEIEEEMSCAGRCTGNAQSCGATLENWSISPCIADPLG